MSFRKILLSAVAGFASLGTAHAADIPMAAAAPAPMDYLQWCDKIGNGFYVIPGSDTCLKIGGYVRAEYNYVEANSYLTDNFTTRGRGRVEFDARTITDYGTLRSFAAIELQNNSGAAQAQVQSAYITFAGITAGRADSYFDFFPNDGLYLGQRVSMATVAFAGSSPVGSVDRAQEVLGYEAKFDTFRFAISAENAVNRQVEITNPISGGKVASFDSTDRGYGGQVMPDIVGRVNYDGAWGNAQLSGVLHQLRAKNSKVDTEYGFAVQGGVKILLPFIEAGDYVNFHAAYASGAMSYLGYNVNDRNVSGSGALAAMNASTRVSDAVIVGSGLNLSLDQSTGYTLAANMRHFWAPGVLRSNVAVSYTNVEQSAAGALNDFNEIITSANIVWTPRSNIAIGPEVQYRRLDYTAFNGVNPSAPGKLTDDEIRARFRIQRDF